jgi:succinate dehydrogenase / fumarate reductase flavoprotein subunit
MQLIQIHPTAIPGDDKLRLMSESARGEGGRIWTYKDGKPWDTYIKDFTCCNITWY